MATISKAYSSIADVNLWLKSQSNDELFLADIPSIIPLRWTYLRDNWNFIKKELTDLASTSADPDLYKDQINSFSDFIDFQRNSKAKINPFSDLKNFYRFYLVFENISINSIDLTNEESNIITNEIDRIRAFSKNDFINAKKNIIEYRDRLNDTYGLSDSGYNAAVNRSSIPSQVNATIADINFTGYLQQSIKTIDFILANLFAVDTAIDPFALARANANNQEINIGQYSSGRLVRLNYGETLQTLALRYFDDPEKWLDIAIANGLKPPYIDEIGERIPLLSNGNSNQINLSETDLSGNLNIDKLYINQPVFLQSTAEVIVDQRSILNIKQIPVSGEIIIELDGPRDLDKYKVIHNANIRVYKPNTINSSFYILIPSSEPLDSNRKEEVPWFLAKSAEDEKKAGIDLAISNNGELLFDTNGDIKLSYGIDNAIQAIKLKLITELGSLRYHPEFGLVSVIGQTNQDVASIRSLLVESINRQVQLDSRFDRVENISVDYLVNGADNNSVAAFVINLSVKMAGGGQVIPISFTVNRT
jgi:hypothetical protein